MYDEPVSVEFFCQRFVESMGEESDHVHIVALTDALQVSWCPGGFGVHGMLAITSALNVCALNTRLMCVAAGSDSGHLSRSQRRWRRRDGRGGHVRLPA